LFGLNSYQVKIRNATIYLDKIIIIFEISVWNRNLKIMILGDFYFLVYPHTHPKKYHELLFSKST